MFFLRSLSPLKNVPVENLTYGAGAAAGGAADRAAVLLVAGDRVAVFLPHYSRH